MLARRVNSVWKKMHSVSHMTLEAEHTGVCWKGAGQVFTLALEHGNKLIFNEKGFWRMAGGRSLHFVNQCIWLFKEELGELHFLRKRMELASPELLVRFVYDVKLGIWRQSQPHICGRDCYTARLVYSDDVIILSWSIWGPKKRDRVNVTYS